MAVIELMRKAKGGRPTGTKSDLRVYVTREKGRPGSAGRFSIGLRVSETCMKRLRWIIGDHVSASFDDEAVTWTLRRVADRKGNALSAQGKNRGAATVRFAVEESHMPTFGLEVGEGYDATLTSDEGDCAVFSVK